MRDRGYLLVSQSVFRRVVLRYWGAHYLQ